MTSRILVTATLLLAGTLAAAAVDVSIPRKTVPVTDSIRIVFTVDRQVSRPDFSPLQRDFEILGTSQSTSMSIVNGRMTQSASWTVELMPRRVGTAIVPPIDFDGELSPEREIEVTAAATDPGGAPAGEVFLEVEADPASPYVQSQIRFTVRVFRSVPTSDASLSEPGISVGDAVIERLGDDVAYETERGGVRFSVVERRYTIFPQASGKIVVDPLAFAARVGGRGSMLDPLRRGRIVRVRSESMEIDVRPIPDGFPGQVWLPAERLDLIEEWPGGAEQWRVGEPLTRTLTLRARGLTASQLPEIGMPVPAGLKQYPDQPQLQTSASDETQLAMRRETVALIPSRPGEFVLPAIEIPWWNTRSDRLEYARLPARTVNVLPAPGGTADTRAGQASELDTPAPQPVEAGPGTTATTAPGSHEPWILLSAALAALWLGTLGAWLWSSRRGVRSERAQDIARPPKPAAAAKAVERACAANDAAAAQDALLQWAAARWPGNPARSLGELGARLDGPLQHEVHALSRARYGADADGWQGAALARALRDDKAPGGKQTVAAPQLEPLYRA